MNKCDALKFKNVGLVLGICLSLSAFGSPISGDQALQAMSKWIRIKPAAQMIENLGKTVREVRSVKDDAGREIFHVIKLNGGGFIITSTDNRIHPVVGFFEGDDLREDDNNPLWQMLRQDMAKRLDQVEQYRPRLMSVASASDAVQESSPEAEWAELLAVERPRLLAASTPTSPTAVTDVAMPSGNVRVPVMVQSRWNQTTDETDYYYCYNYYTPYAYPCGCLATAMAQVMRYHMFPNYQISWWWVNCWVDNENTVDRYDMMVKNGAYDWASMPYRPGRSGTTTTTYQRQQIGKLCFDVGVSLAMSWNESGSGACAPRAAFALTDIFKYASAKHHQGRLAGTIVQSSLYGQLVYANLDAGYPVILCTIGNGSKSTKKDGFLWHSVVADGYGEIDGSIYTHLNIGWGGSYDGWYSLGDFTPIQDVVYNVFPRASGELLTGRVTYTDGTPIEGALVKAVCGARTLTKQTNAYGIYSFVVDGGTQWTVTASANGTASRNTVVTTVPTSRSDELLWIAYNGEHECNENGSVGNRWGVNLQIEKVSDLSITQSYLSRSSASLSSVTVFEVGETVYAKTSVRYEGAPLDESFLVRQVVTDANGEVVVNVGDAYWFLNNETPKTMNVNNEVSRTLLPGIYTYTCTLNGTRRIDESDYSNNSRSISFEVLTPVPGQVGSLTGGKGTVTAANLSWSGVAYANSYSVYRATAQGGSAVLLASGLTTTQYADTTAVPGTTYWYEVVAVNSRGSGVGCWVSAFRTESLNWPASMEEAISRFGAIDRETAEETPSPGSTGPKYHADGVTPMTLWDDFVAGTDPCDSKSVFKASIGYENGVLKISWSPDLNEAGTKSVRTYQTWGSNDLKSWGKVNSTDTTDYNFYKITVSYP